ncbi:hypothetical protein, partial [Klebsiella pneumoniae]|uniref:hypothetical protein n=1 Tax=Klebsiella pneumoniae TaxID=573 RepID=UPI002963D734
RFTMLIDIAPRGFEVRKRGLRFNKQQFHQFAGCIINIRLISFKVNTPELSALMICLPVV